MYINAVIGFPLHHTLSPALHNAIYDRMGMTATMIAVPHADIRVLVGKIRDEQIGLTAVTIPHKETILTLLDFVSPEARAIGAVNTVISSGGVLYGYNTDVVGIGEALRGVSLSGKRVLLVGAGGAARAVAYYVTRCGGVLLCTNRTREKADTLAQEFGGTLIDLNTIDGGSVDVIVNTTPIGMYPRVDESPIPSDVLRSHHVIFDLVYNPLQTKLMEEALGVGARIISGLDMFVAQGLAQERLWQNRDIEGEGLREVLVKELHKELFKHQVIDQAMASI